MRLVFVSVKSFETFTLVVYLRYDSKLRHGEDPTDKAEVLCALSLPSVLSSSRFLGCLPRTDGRADAAPRGSALPAGFCVSPWPQPGLGGAIHPADQEGTCTRSKSSLHPIFICKKSYK